MSSPPARCKFRYSNWKQGPPARPALRLVLSTYYSFSRFHDKRISLDFTTKGNTIGLGWPRLQRFTRHPARHPKPLESPHRKATPLHGQKLFQLLASETCWALMSSESQLPCEGTGANIFESTECHCGKFVNRLGLHGLSCIKNAGRYPYNIQP